MEKLKYTITIATPARVVWDTMLQQETYREWVAKSWPDSFYEGKWETGELMRFIGPYGSGTLAEIKEVRKYEKVSTIHIAILQAGGVEDRTSAMAKGWIGSLEEYLFTEHDGNTTLRVLIETNPEWKKMFDDGWPTALEELKKISERQLASV